MKPLIDEWETLEKEVFTPDEIAASDLRVAIISELIKARNEYGVSQKNGGAQRCQAIRHRPYGKG